MFTGIVQGLATVSELERRGEFMVVKVVFPSDALAGVEVGASIALNGVCLTVTRFSENWATFDVIDETLACTSLGTLERNERINFERAATFGSEIGGHLLSGHIVDTVTVCAREESSDNCTLRIQVPEQWSKYIIAKGYIAVDGVSLTIGTVSKDDHWFSVHLIPETLSRTTLGTRMEGDVLNLELDAMTQAVVDTVERVMAAKG